MSDQGNALSRHHAFLESEYRLKVDLLTRQYDRILTRFNYFLAIESGLFGLAGFLWRENLRPVIFALAIVGLLSALLWLLTSIADRRLVTAYRYDARIAYYHLLKSFCAAPDLKLGAERPERRALASLQTALRFYKLILRGKDSSRNKKRPSFKTSQIVNERIRVAAGDVGERGSVVLGKFKFSVTRMPIWASVAMTAMWCLVLYALIRPQDFGLRAWSSGLRDHGGLPSS